MIKNNKEKIFELKIEEDDEVSGVDSISLVDEPAIEFNWVAFSKFSENKHEFHIPDGEDNLYSAKLLEKAQLEEDFLNEGYEFVKYIEDDFLSTSPNDESKEDTSFYRVRYKYTLAPNIRQNAIIPTTRAFCKDLLMKNYVWREEDIEAITNDFGDSARKWRGGFNCRHQWSKMLYKATGDIINKASNSSEKITGPLGIAIDLTPDFNQPSTITQKTLDNPSPSTIKNLGLKKEDMGYDVGGITPYVDELPKKKKKKKDGDVIPKSLVEPTTFLDEFEYLKTDLRKQRFQTDDEKRIVLGPCMVPGQNIFRKDEFGNPYYVFFSESTIRMIQEKYFKNKFIDNNDLMHDGEAASDVFVIESWIKESDNDKSTDYGFKDLPVGTWFVAMKVNNPEVWTQIKSGKLNGFSVSGFFSEELAFSKEEMFLHKVAEILKKY